MPDVRVGIETTTVFSLHYGFKSLIPAREYRRPTSILSPHFTNRSPILTSAKLSIYTSVMGGCLSFLFGSRAPPTPDDDKPMMTVGDQSRATTFNVPTEQGVASGASDQNDSMPVTPDVDFNDLTDQTEGSEDLGTPSTGGKPIRTSVELPNLPQYSDGDDNGSTRTAGDSPNGPDQASDVEPAPGPITLPVPSSEGCVPQGPPMGIPRRQGTSQEGMPSCRTSGANPRRRIRSRRCSTRRACAART